MFHFSVFQEATAGNRSDWGPLITIPQCMTWQWWPSSLIHSFLPHPSSTSHSTQPWYKYGCIGIELSCSMIRAETWSPPDLWQITKQGLWKWGISCSRQRALKSIIHTSLQHQMGWIWEYCGSRPQSSSGCSLSSLKVHGYQRGPWLRGKKKQMSHLSLKMASRDFQRFFLTKIFLQFQLQSSALRFVL